MKKKHRKWTATFEFQLVPIFKRLKCVRGSHFSRSEWFLENKLEQTMVSFLYFFNNIKIHNKDIPIPNDVFFGF